MDKQKIMIIIPNLKVAGAQKMVEQLSLEIDRQQFEVYLICLSSRSNSFIEKRLRASGIDIEFLNKKSGFSLSVLFKVCKCVKKINPDIIHTHVTSWVYSFPIAWMKRITILHTIHSRPNRQESNVLTRKFIKFLYHKHILIPIAISEEIKKEAEKVYNLQSNEVEMVVNPVDYVSFSKVQKRRHEGVVFVNVARFDEVKNQCFLINAFAKAYNQNNNVRLVLAGEGPLMREAQELTDRLKLNNSVKFLGNVDDVPALFSYCDVFVLPSLTEGLPVSMLEAEAAGLPVIASRIGGIPDIFDNNGYLITVNDEHALVESILEFENDEIRERKGENSRKIAANYSADKVARRYEALYKKYRRLQ